MPLLCCLLATQAVHLLTLPSVLLLQAKALADRRLTRLGLPGATLMKMYDLFYVADMVLPPLVPQSVPEQCLRAYNVLHSLTSFAFADALSGMSAH